MVTVVGCWLGYELNWIRQRHEAASKYDASPGLSLGPSMVLTKHQPPGMLRFFGEEGYLFVGIALPFRQGEELTPPEEAELQRVRRLFPEAYVYISTQVHLISATKTLD